MLLKTTEAPPAISQPWQGGTYAGLVRATDEEGDYHLVLLADKPEKPLGWDAALAWAESLGASLPTRRESSILFGNLGEYFERRWHWTNEQSSAHFAWSQYFDDGSQYDYVKDDEGRARAVRRFKVSP